LVSGVDEPPGNFIEEFIDNAFFLFNEIFIHDFPGNKEEEEPDDIDQVDNDDGVELPEEVDVGSKQVEADWPVLHNIAHPLVFNGGPMRLDEEVEVLDEV